MKYEFHPLADEYPMLTGWVYEKLKADLKENGQINRIALWQCKILDGRNRYKALMELDIEPVFKEMKFKSDEEARAWVRSMNDRRRHESLDVVKARSERKAKVAELRKEGKSTRAIAEEVGVSQKTIVQDIQGDTTVSPEPEPSANAVCSASNPA